MQQRIFAERLRSWLWRGAWGLLPALMAGAGVLGLLDAVSSLQAGALGFSAHPDTVITGPGFPRTIVDPAGFTTTLAAPPRRMVSVSLASDEILLELAGPERLAGLSNLAKNPVFARHPEQVPKHVQLVSADPEKLLSLEPDVVFVAGYTRAETVQLLAAAGVPVVRITRYSSVADVVATIELIGRAAGNEAAARALQESVADRVAAVSTAVAGRRRPRVAYYLDGGTAGQGTLMDDLIERAGGHNVAREAGVHGDASVPLERLIGLQPEIVITVDWSGAAEPPAPAQILEDPLWQTTPAVQNGRVHALPAALALSVSHHVAETLERLAGIIHPEAF